MNNEIRELENIINGNLSIISHFKNQIEQIENEKHDQLKEIVLGIIDMIDSFERVEEEIVEKNRKNNKDIFKTMKRYQSIHTKLIYLIEKYGITKIEFPDNRLIVGLCEVVGTENDESKENDEIISIIRNGYQRENELIRAAKIIVVKN
jgi:molecular chaperone GrpE (heat shock protein)